MYGIIASAHGRCASGVYSGLELVCGAMDQIKIVDFLQEYSAEDLDQKLSAAFDELKDFEKKIILTDLAGGTPFNRAVLLFAKDKNVRVLSGLNFPLLYNAATLEAGADFDADIEEILQEGKDGITCYKEVERVEVVEDDGI